MLDPLSDEWLPELILLEEKLTAAIPEFEPLEPKTPLISGWAVNSIHYGSIGALSLLIEQRAQEAYDLAKATRTLAEKMRNVSTGWSEEAQRRFTSAWFRTSKVMAEAAEGSLDWAAALSAVDHVLLHWQHLSLLTDDEKFMAASMIESVTRFLLEQVRVREATELIAATPPDLSQHHQAWHEVVEMVAQVSRPATVARPTEAVETVGRLKSELQELLGALEEGPNRDFVQATFDQLQASGRSDRDNMMEIIRIIQQEMTGTRAFSSMHDLKVEAFELEEGYKETTAEDLARRIDRLHEISLAFAERRHLDFHVTIQLMVFKMEAKLRRLPDARRSAFTAIEGSEARLWQNPDVFSGGEIARLRDVYSNAISHFFDVEDYASAFFLAERFKDLLGARIQDRATLFPAECIERSFPPPSVRGVVMSIWAFESSTIVIVRTEDGVFRARGLPLDRKLVRAIIGKLRPSAWRTFGMFDPPINVLIRGLSLLTNWIPAELLEGKLLTISPDGGLHNVPWHLLTCSDREILTIAPTQIVVAVPFQVEEKTPRPSSAAIFCVPSLDETHAEKWRSWAVQLTSKLGAHISDIVTISDLEATVERCVSEMTVRDVVHVRSHGYFPAFRESRDNNDAFALSGLLLAAGGRLPDRTDQSVANLTPAAFKQLVDKQPGSIGHVTLEACVSGVSVEGITAAPISLPWMLNLYGAKCVLASYWDIETAASEMFFETFYDAWLAKGLTRPEALQAAGLAVIERHGRAAAGFRLLGACDD